MSDILCPSSINTLTFRNFCPDVVNFSCFSHLYVLKFALFSPQVLKPVLRFRSKQKEFEQVQRKSHEAKLEKLERAFRKF